MEAYCVKCKMKREMQDPQAVFTAAGTPGTRGTCGVCGTKMFRMGKTEAHESLTPPPPEARKRRKKKSKPRSGNLVIVESPAKARTVGRYLGKGYTVRASVGHVRDLLRSQLSVDVDNHFQPKYRVPNDKRPLVKELKELAKSADQIFLATDPDREGEAIAWHLLESAEMAPERTHRVVFHEITKPAIEEAFSNPREINMELVNAQQARRVLDRLVGYSLSPLLWRKIRGRLSAGRVQSAALRLVVEREREIDAFEPREYWTIAAELSPGEGQKLYTAKLVRINGEEPVLDNQQQVDVYLDDMEAAEFIVSKVKRGTRKRSPFAPFTTSTMQQDASRRLGFTAKRTMAIAQQLYEGIDMGSGDNTGLITYMRTDSTNVSEVAQKEAREYILKQHGEAFLPEKPPKYRTKARAAQEAHEAVRPTSVFRTPKSIKEHLSRDQYRLYQLIWNRFVASQMTKALFDTLSVEISAQTQTNLYLLRAAGSNVRFPGFMVVYKALKKENGKKGENGKNVIPPDLKVGDKQSLVHLLPEQHFTQPPPRFGDATLVATMEENGIGRPSTYASILGTLLQRHYVIREEKRFFPTETGILVNDLLTQYFPNIVDSAFTARMEADLDQVAMGKQDWVSIVSEFYGPFADQVAHADHEIPKMQTELEKVGRACPKCGADLVIRWGRFGRFISCSTFPECRHTEPFLEKIGVTCPKDGGDLVLRKTRKGRIFYACSNYPDCDFTSWKRPLPKPCPHCQGLLVIANKRNAQCTQCETTFPLDEVQEESAD